MSVPAATPSDDEEPERRRSQRVRLEMALQLVIDGKLHPARAVLASREGVLTYSLKVCSPGSIIEARDPATGRSTRVRVAWCWVDQGTEVKSIRLALEKVEATPTAWEQEYEEKLREETAQATDRRRSPRQNLQLAVDVGYEGRIEHAATLDVSDEGACLSSRESYAPGSLLRVVWCDVARDADFRVVWSRQIAAPRDASHFAHYRVGIELVPPTPDAT